MAEERNRAGPPDLITAERIKAVDSLYWSPVERANGVNTIYELTINWLRSRGVPESDIPTLWDRLCHAVEFVANAAVIIGDSVLADISHRLVFWLYSSYYTHAEKIIGKPDKRRSEDDVQPVTPFGGATAAFPEEVVRRAADNQIQDG